MVEPMYASWRIATKDSNGLNMSNGMYVLFTYSNDRLPARIVDGILVVGITLSNISKFTLVMVRVRRPERFAVVAVVDRDYDRHFQQDSPI